MLKQIEMEFPLNRHRAFVRSIRRTKNRMGRSLMRKKIKAAKAVSVWLKVPFRRKALIVP